MMKRRTFVQAASVLGASFCSGLSASAQILQPSLPSFVALQLKDLKSQVLQNTEDLAISNRYVLAEDLFSVKRIVKEEYKGNDFTFVFKNRTGNTIRVSKDKGVVKTVVA